MSEELQPERIWVAASELNSVLRRVRPGGWHKDGEREPGSDYVRADIAAARIAALEEALREARAALERAQDAICDGVTMDPNDHDALMLTINSILDAKP